MKSTHEQHALVYFCNTVTIYLQQSPTQHSIWDSLRVTYDSSQAISEVQIRFSGYAGD